MGMEGALFTDLKAALYAKSDAEILGFVAGLGGRDITIEDFKAMARKGFSKARGEKVSEMEWHNLDTDILPEGI
jgi:pyruvate ferredoxin oxidoreductase alpha subunit